MEPILIAAGLAAAAMFARRREAPEVEVDAEEEIIDAPVARVQPGLAPAASQVVRVDANHVHVRLPEGAILRVPQGQVVGGSSVASAQAELDALAARVGERGLTSRIKGAAVGAGVPSYIQPPTPVVPATDPRADVSAQLAAINRGPTRAEPEAAELYQAVAVRQQRQPRTPDVRAVAIAVNRSAARAAGAAAKLSLVDPTAARKTRTAVAGLRNVAVTALRNGDSAKAAWAVGRMERVAEVASAGARL